MHADNEVARPLATLRPGPTKQDHQRKRDVGYAMAMALRHGTGSPAIRSRIFFLVVSGLVMAAKI